MENTHVVTLVENGDSKSVKACCGPEDELVGKVCGNNKDGWTVAEWWPDGTFAPRPGQASTDRDSALGRLVRLVLARG